MEQIQSTSSSSDRKSSDSWIKWLVAALIALLNGYAIIMMYAGGEIAFALLDLIVVSVGLYVFMSKRMYAHRYIFPGVAGMVVFIIFPLAYTISIAFTNYSGSNLLSLENARAYHLKKTYKVQGGEYDFTLLERDDKRFQLMLAQDDLRYISGPCNCGPTMSSKPVVVRLPLLIRSVWFRWMPNRWPSLPPFVASWIARCT